jgi:hypothetical protein
MVHLDSPCLEAGLYWLREAPQVSFRRVCQALIHQGLDTLGCGEFAAPNDALLALLEQPHTEVQEASFMTSSKKRAGVRATQRPPGKVTVSYGWLSDAAQAHGDHPVIQVTWGGSSFSGPPGYTAPDAPAKGLQAYRFFTLLCAQLAPLYAGLEMEMKTDCLYDVLHPTIPESISHLTFREFYCQRGLLGEAEAAFWQTYAYHEQLPHGTYGSDSSLFNPRRRSLPGDGEPHSHVVATRRAILLPALKRFARSQHMT